MIQEMCLYETNQNPNKNWRIENTKLIEENTFQTIDRAVVITQVENLLKFESINLLYRWLDSISLFIIEVWKGI